MHTDILSFHVDDENVKGDDKQCRGGVGALSQYLMSPKRVDASKREVQ